MIKQEIDYSIYENKYIFNSRQNKNLLNKKQKFSFLTIFFCVILLLSLCVFLKPKSKNIYTFYYVEIAHFQTYKDALYLSNELRESDAAGVIFYDETYRVLAGFYSSKNDAEKVVENLKNEYPRSQIFELEFFTFQDKKSCTKKQLSSTKNLIDEILSLITGFEKLIIQMSTEEINFTQSKTIIQNIFYNYNSSLNEFLVCFKTDNKSNIAKQKANEILNSIGIMLNANDQEFIQILRQELVNITISFSQFMSNI